MTKDSSFTKEDFKAFPHKSLCNTSDLLDEVIFIPWP